MDGWNLYNAFSGNPSLFLDPAGLENQFTFDCARSRAFVAEMKALEELFYAYDKHSLGSPPFRKFRDITRNQIRRVYSEFMKFAKKRAREAKVEFELGKAKAYVRNANVSMNVIKMDRKCISSFVVPEKSLYQKAHDNFMEKMEKGAQREGIAFREYVREYMRRKLVEAGEKLIQPDDNAKYWAKECTSVTGNICGPLSNELAIYFWNVEKIPVFIQGTDDHRRLVLFVGNQFNAREMEIRTNWLILDLQIRNELHKKKGKEMNVSESRLRDMFKNDLEEAFFAYTGYFRGSFRTTEIWLPKMFKAYTDKSRNEAMGQRLLIKMSTKKRGMLTNLFGEVFGILKDFSITKFINKEWLQSK